MRIERVKRHKTHITEALHRAQQFAGSLSDLPTEYQTIVQSHLDILHTPKRVYPRLVIIPHPQQPNLDGLREFDEYL